MLWRHARPRTSDVFGASSGYQGDRVAVARRRLVSGELARSVQPRRDAVTRAWSVATDGRRTADWAVILPSPSPWRSVRLWTAVKMCPCVPSELPQWRQLVHWKVPVTRPACMLNQRAPDPTWRCNDLISAYQPCYLATPETVASAAALWCEGGPAATQNGESLAKWLNSGVRPTAVARARVTALRLPVCPRPGAAAVAEPRRKVCLGYTW